MERLTTLQDYARQRGLTRQAVMKGIHAGRIAAVHQDDPQIPKGRWMIIDAPAAPAPDVPTTPDSTSNDLADATTPSLAYIPGQLPRREKVPEAQAFAMLMEAIEARLESATSRGAEWRAMTQEYNAKLFIPELYRYRNKRTERALRHWYQVWRANDRDMFALVRKPAGRTGRKVTKLEQDYLFAHLLTDKRLSIASVIQDIKSAAASGHVESPSSARTLKRWLHDWIAANPDIWAQARKGSKFVRENIVKSIMRDTSMLGPGDVLVADGHTLAFDVINPITGRPARLTLILIYDWASRYPVGASLAATESSQHILTAVRNAILHLKMIPKSIYIDNGRAFRAQLFHKTWEDHDLEREFAGIFPRLGIEAAFAEPYNARSKVIERFFKTLQEQFERFQSSFRGRNIDDKPANLSRNEKWAIKMFAGEPLEYAQAMDLIYYFFRYEYGLRPHAGLNGQKPYDVFAARAIDPVRAVDPSKLDFLMLVAERKKLRSEGIWLNKCRYYHPIFTKYVGQELVIRYDYSDLRYILVYDASNHYLCTAELREAQHAFVHLDQDNPLAYHRLVSELRENQRAIRSIEKNTQKIIRASRNSLDAAIAHHREARNERLDAIKAHNPVFVQPPMITPPLSDAPDPRDVVSRLAAEARAAETGEDTVIDTTPPPSSASTFAQKLTRRGIGTK